MNATETGVVRPQRWDSPFDAAMLDLNVDTMLSVAPFKTMDQGRFPESLPLAGLLKNDSRIRKFTKGDIVVRAGDYGNSAFLVLSGTATVILPPGLDDSSLGHSKTNTLGIFDTIKRALQRSPYPETRAYSHLTSNQQIASRAQQPNQIYLPNIDELLTKHQHININEGDMFGEVAALARIQRNATVCATTELEVLEVRWQAIRDIRRYAPAFKTYIDNLYRERNLLTHLREIPAFRHLADDAIANIAENTLFESYGEFEWHSSFKRHSKQSGNTQSLDQLMFAEGDYPDGLIFIRSGFAKITKSVNHGEHIVSVLSKGGLYGMEELLQNTKGDDLTANRTSLYAIGYTDILRVPTHIIEELVLPTMPKALFDEIQSKHDYSALAQVSSSSQAQTDFIEFAVDHRLINGTATMLINQDRCTRCDECVHACAASHEGNPRFIRHGKQHANQLVTNACMHCVDPVCMIGCPTGAIHRSEQNGEVVINDIACIGCATCANSCPYDNIRMVEIRDAGGSLLQDQQSNLPIVKASKCDLCFNLPHGPACVNACPYNAITRIDMTNNEQLTQWLSS